MNKLTDRLTKSPNFGFFDGRSVPLDGNHRSRLLSVTRYAAIALRDDGYALRVNSALGLRCTIAWVILTIVLSSTPSTAQPVFLAGRYVLPITQHDIYVSAPGSLGTTVTVNCRMTSSIKPRWKVITPLASDQVP